MTATAITVTAHAAERIAERLEPILGIDATALVEDVVLDAVWNFRFRRSAPKWSTAHAKVRGERMRYACGSACGVRIVAVVALEPGCDPVLVTVLTDRMPRRVHTLALLPSVAEGLVIGLPRVGELPVAFEPVAA